METQRHSEDEARPPEAFLEARENKGTLDLLDDAAPKIPIGSQTRRFPGCLKNNITDRPLAAGLGISEFITELSATFSPTNIAKPTTDPAPRCSIQFWRLTPSASNRSSSRRSSRAIVPKTMGCCARPRARVSAMFGFGHLYQGLGDRNLDGIVGSGVRARLPATVLGPRPVIAHAFSDVLAMLAATMVAQ